MSWREHTDDTAYPPQRWSSPYAASPHGERLAHIEAFVEHQRVTNGSINSRLNNLEQAQRRSEQMGRLKAERKAARRDVIKAVQWFVSILASVAYVGHLVLSGQWLDLLRFVLGLDSS